MVGKIKFINLYHSLAVITLVFFVGSIFIPIIASATPAQEAEKASLEAEASALDQQIAILQGKEATAASELALTQAKVSKIQLQINIFQAEIDKNNTDILNIDQQIISTTEEITTSKEFLKEYIKVIYMDGQTSFIENLMISDNFSDFVDSNQYLSSSQEKLNDQVNKITALRERLVTDKQNIETKKASTAKLQQEQLAQRYELDKLAEYQSGLKRQIATQKNDTISLKASKKKEAANIQYQIDHPPIVITSTTGVTPASGVPQYYQTDISWSSSYINNGNKPAGADPSTIGAWGCALTSLAMIFSSYGYNINPRQVATNPGFFSTGWNWDLVSWGGISPSTGGRFSASTTLDTTSGWVTSKADQLASSGTPFMVSVHFGSGFHYVVITGKNASGQWIMNDPIFGGSKVFSYNSIEQYVFINAN